MVTAATEKLLTPNNCVVAFIDQQPQMSFGVQSHDRQLIKNNTLGLAKACKVFGVPTVLTTVETESFSGYTWPELVDVLEGQPTAERSSMNAWEDEGFVAAVKASGRKKLVLCGLWTEVCIAFPSLPFVHWMMVSMCFLSLMPVEQPQKKHMIWQFCK